MDLRDKNRQKKRIRLTFTIVAFILIAICIFVSILRGFGKLRKSQEAALIEDMKSLVDRQATSLEFEVKQIQKTLIGTRDILRANQMGDRPVEDSIELIKPIVNLESMNRLGIVDANGDTLTTDGIRVNLAFADFFDMSIRGHNYISDLITDSIIESDKDIVVFSTPLYIKDGSVTHILYAAYDASVLYNQLSIDIGAADANCVITDLKGHLISHHFEDADKATITSIFEYLPENAQTEKMREDLLASKSDYILLPNDGDYIYYAPFEVDTGASSWAILCFVPHSSLSLRMAEIMYDVPRMVGLVAALLVLAAVLFIVNKRISANEDRQRLKQIAYTDRLTQGYNYAYFEEKMLHRDHDGYILSIDIHAFRAINSAVGTKAGDQVLIAIWKVLEDSLKPNEIAARVNSDHFTMFLLENSKEDVAARLDAITARIKDISNILSTPEVIPFFGACACDASAELKEVENHAIISRHMVSMDSDANYAFYSDFDSNALLEQSRLVKGFEKAINNREFKIWYQPKYNPANSEIVGAEALVRWHSNNQIIAPFKFIPLYEEDGKIRDLDAYMFRMVCEQQVAWRESGHRLVPISVNLSRVSAYQTGLVEEYSKIMDEYNLEHHLVPIEITESAAIDDELIRNVVNQFAENGFSVHMDDFGSGYSSLSSLINLRFDTIKVDKSLTDTIGEGEGERIIFHTIALAKELGLRVTVEGVENENQLSFLKPLNCDDIQGYYYSKPLMLEDFNRVFV